jgi:hypothetical protein
MATDDNPYAPPLFADHVVGVKSGRSEDLKAVAVAQKSIIVCMALYLVLIIVQLIMTQTPAFRPYGAYLALVVLVIGLVGMVSVFLLAIRVYSIASGILLGIGAILPCFGLVILWMINRKATSILQQNGHHVGFFGADLSKF